MQRVLRNIRIKKSIAIMMSVVIVCTSYMDAFRYTHAQAENTDEVSV